MQAIIIGATSGIGRELAKQMSSLGYTVGITGRRTELLESLAQELFGRCFVAPMDLCNIEQSVIALEALIAQMGNVDVIVLNAGVGSNDANFPLADELATLAVNVNGFTAMANVAAHYFAKQGAGHIVGISSVAAVRGGPITVYNASKAYVSHYLEGLRCRFYRTQPGIFVTDIRPGFVATAMAKGEGLFWVASVERAALQIVRAIQQKRSIAYVTKRWWLIALILRLIPFGLYCRLISPRIEP